MTSKDNHGLVNGDVVARMAARLKLGDHMLQHKFHLVDLADWLIRLIVADVERIICLSFSLCFCNKEMQP
jgi:hypothetical protein